MTKAARPRRSRRSDATRIPYSSTTPRRNGNAGKRLRSVESILDDAQEDAARLASCPWWTGAVGALSTGCYDGLVCLGLGSFLSSVNARAQLAAALRLRAVHLADGDAPCYIADPAMVAEDKDVCTRAGFLVVAGFDEAMESTALSSTGARLLLFMPHCERALYEHVLGSLWGERLERTELFGNCFSAFYGAGESAYEDWGYMDAVVADKVAVEHPCGDASQSIWHNAFNDLAVTVFEGSKTDRWGSAGIWSWRPAPQLRRVAGETVKIPS